MISKAKIKLIRSLDNKKARRKSGVFVAEGPKVVGDLLQKEQAKIVIATEDWITENCKLMTDIEVIKVDAEELRKASLLQHPQQVLALFPLPQEKTDSQALLPLLVGQRNGGREALVIALDGVQDPGNLGTIIRVADWFGIEDVICSLSTVDAYSPKVIQATMGSIARVRVHYTDLERLITSLPKDFPVYGTCLNGTDLYEQQLSDGGLIVMGNEGNGISPAIKALLNRRLLIPNYPKERATADSLNVAIATAITCAEFRRRTVS